MDSPIRSDEDNSHRAMREFSRADGYLPVQINRVRDEERPYVRSHSSLEAVLTQHPAMPEHDDRVLAECLQILNAKLDSILRMLTFHTMDYKSLSMEQVNISAGGICTLNPEHLEEGQLVEIRLILPNSPYTVLYMYGNVVKCEPESRKFLVSVEFTEIDEDIRDQVAKYVFDRQRELIRKNRRP